MPSRAYIAHDRAVSAARMYIQMGVVGFLLAGILYAIAMNAFLSRYFADPIPELTYIQGVPRLIVTAKSPHLRHVTLLKYYVSLNPANYVKLQLRSMRSGSAEKVENVEPELQKLLPNRQVPREAYRQAIYLISHGRVEYLRWMIPLSLLYFPVFGLIYFFTFSWLNRRASKTRFVRGDDLMRFDQMKSALNQAIADERKTNPSLLPLRLGQVSLPDAVSRRHILILGTTGTGKSVCLNQYVTSLKARRAASEIGRAHV